MSVEPKQISTVPDDAFGTHEEVLAARRIMCRARDHGRWDWPAREFDFDGDAEKAGFAALRAGGWLEPTDDGAWAAGDSLVAAIVAGNQQAGTSRARQRKAERTADEAARTRVQADLVARLVGRRIEAVEDLRVSDFGPGSNRVDAGCRLRLDDGSEITVVAGDEDDAEFRFDLAPAGATP